MFSAADLVGAAQKMRRDGIEAQVIQHRILAIIIRHGLRAEIDGDDVTYSIKISNGLTFSHTPQRGYSCGH